MFLASNGRNVRSFCANRGSRAQGGVASCVRCCGVGGRACPRGAGCAERDRDRSCARRTGAIHLPRQAVLLVSLRMGGRRLVLVRFWHLCRRRLGRHLWLERLGRAATLPRRAGRTAIPLLARALSKPPSRRRPATNLLGNSVALASGRCRYDCAGGCLSSPANSAAGNCARHAGLGHAVPRPNPILTRQEKTCSPQRRHIGMAPPPSGRPLRFVRETSDMLAGRRRDLTPPTTRSNCLTETHRCRVISFAEPKPFPPPA